jgi:hypothetical protein
MVELLLQLIQVHETLVAHGGDARHGARGAVVGTGTNCGAWLAPATRASAGKNAPKQYVRLVEG